MSLPYSLPFSLPTPIVPTVDLDNLSFEYGDTNPGDAWGWVLTVVAGAETVATWGTPDELDEETFETGWNADAYLFEFGLADTAPPLFDLDVSDGEAIEDFEEGWDGNQAYLFELGVSAVASFDTAPEDYEDHEEGWDTNESYDFALGASVAASFDAALTPEDIEDFEDGFSGTGAGNDYELVMGATTLAVFDGGTPENFEDFEETFTPLQLTAAAGADLFTTGAAHGLSVGDEVTFSLSGAGALPTGIVPGYTYFVIAGGFSPTSFSVSLTSGGPIVDITDNGAGAFFVRGDTERLWNLD